MCLVRLVYCGVAQALYFFSKPSLHKHTGPAHEYVETTAGLCTPECLPALENSAAAAAQYAPRLLPPCARNAASSAHPTDTQDSLQWASSKRMGMLLVPPRSWWGVFAQVRRAGCGDAA